MSRRTNLGVYDTLLQELRSEDEGEYRKFLRMTPENFDELLELIKADISKYDTNMRDSIPANIKLAATVRYLATGESYSELQYQFRIHSSTLGKFIPLVCEAIHKRLRDKYMKVCNNQYFSKYFSLLLI